MARKLKTDLEESMKQNETITPSNLAETADDSAFHRSRCGGALRHARETQGLTVQDVASKLRLGLKQIDAIEADQFEKLPEATIIRGFIRNYAKLLKINAEPLLDAYTVIVPSNMQYELTVKPTSNMLVTSGDKYKSSSYIWAGLVTLLVLAGWLFYHNYIQKPSPTNPNSTNLNSTIDNSSNVALDPLPQSALPAAERPPVGSTALTTSTELSLPPAATDTTVITAPNASQPVPAQPLPALPVPAMTAPVTNPDAASQNSATVSALPLATPPLASPTLTSKTLVKLEFIATQETWVNVIDAEGKTVYDKIIFAGSRETIEAMQPLNVVVGNAGATSLNVNGKSIELGPHARNNVARIKLE